MIVELTFTYTPARIPFGSLGSLNATSSQPPALLCHDSLSPISSVNQLSSPPDLEYEDTKAWTGFADLLTTMMDIICRREVQVSGADKRRYPLYILCFVDW